MRQQEKGRGENPEENKDKQAIADALRRLRAEINSDRTDRFSERSEPSYYEIQGNRVGSFVAAAWKQMRPGEKMSEEAAVSSIYMYLISRGGKI